MLSKPEVSLTASFSCLWSREKEELPKVTQCRLQVAELAAEAKGQALCEWLGQCVGTGGPAQALGAGRAKGQSVNFQRR